MKVRPLTHAPLTQTSGTAGADKVASRTDKTSAEFRDTFNVFVGQTLYGEMLKSMRKTVGKPAYFHGGRTEEIFTQQLDQVLSEKLGKTSAGKFSGPMLELMNLQRK